MLARLLTEAGVNEVCRLDGSVGVLALHGGLEPGTYELASSIADASSCSLYAVIQPDDLRWHVPSIHFAPTASANLARFLAHVEVAVSLHGFDRPGYEGTVLLGGRNRTVASQLAEAISRQTELKVIDDISAIPTGLRGLHGTNPVNMAYRGGVQVELSVEARATATVPLLSDAIVAVVRRRQQVPWPVPDLR